MGNVTHLTVLDHLRSSRLEFEEIALVGEVWSIENQYIRYDLTELGDPFIIIHTYLSLRLKVVDHRPKGI